MDFLVVGDDVLCISASSQVDRLRLALSYVYIDGDAPGYDAFRYEEHGLGIVMRDF